MSQSEVERFLGRLITDEEFRDRAAGSLHTTCYSEGIAVSVPEMAILAQLDFSTFSLLAGVLDDAIRRK